MVVAPEIWFGGTYIDQRPQNFFGQLSTDPEVWPVLNADVEIPPDQLKAWQSERDSFIAGQQLIDRYKWKIGDRIQIQGSYVMVNLDLVLRGVYHGRDESNIFFHNKYLENSWVGRSSTTGIFFLRVRTPGDVPRVTEAINRMFENSDAPVKAMPEKEFNLQFLEMMGNVKLLVRSIALVVLFTVVLIVANTMAMSARERLGEYAVLKTMGFRPRHLAGIIIGESLLLALVGGVLGLALSVPALRLFPEDVSQYFPNLEISDVTAALGLSVALMVGVLAAVLPAWRATRVRIAEALRKVG
jgi:putative ABC transport system permease protein